MGELMGKLLGVLVGRVGELGALVWRVALFLLLRPIISRR